MKYNELKILLAKKQIEIQDFAKQIKMTRQGLQRSLDNDKMPYEKVELCCRHLGITPNEFFGWDDGSSNYGVYASNISGVNNQNSNEAIKALKDQLKEKDKQISRLLSLLEKGTPLASKDDGVPYYSVAAESPAEYSKGGRNK